MRPVLNHPWNLAPSAAVARQRALAGRVRRDSRLDLRRTRLLLGADVSYSRATDTCYAVAVVWDLRADGAIATASAVKRARFPYVPGLLSFREAPALMAAFARIAHPVDVLLVEGQGLAHPRRLGLASHLGVLYDHPTVGCAKSRLVGTHREPASARGSRAALKDGAETVGAVLRTRTGVKPLFVSVGHAVDLDQACRLVLRATLRFRQPEPLRLAHRLANALRREREGG
jgi:deoxyribonuclease V